MNLNEQIRFLISEFLKPYLATFHHHYVVLEGNSIEVGGRKEFDDSGPLTIMVLGINHHNRELHISVLMLPVEDRKKGLGLGLIEHIYRIAKTIEYDLVLVQMVDSFREAMLRRGAIETLVYDALQIVETTDLT